MNPSASSSRPRLLSLFALFLGTFAVVLVPQRAAAQTGLSLFNGTSLTGWVQHGSWVASSGMLQSNANGPRHIQTAVPFSDFSLQFEYNESATLGARVRLWTDRENKGGFLVDLDNSSSSAGIGGIEGNAPSILANTPSGWHKANIEASNGQLEVKIDGQHAASASNTGSRSGYLSFEGSTTGQLQLRNLYITPRNLTASFNGTDLNGWKSINQAPESNGGVGHKMEKITTFGLGGGSTKAHAGKWTVQGGMMHGEDGPGGLESTTPLEDGVLQISAKLRGQGKPQNFTAISLRGTPGQLGGGYEAGIGPFAGQLNPLSRHPAGNPAGLVEQTIIIAGRTIAIWVNGTLTSVTTDSRPESANTAQGARTTPGSLALLLPNHDVQLDIKTIAFAPLAKQYGLSDKKPPPPIAVTVPTLPPPSEGVSATETALLKSQQDQSKQAALDQANKQRTASLMSQALVTTDPKQQMSLYQQVVQIDPSNSAAVQSYKEAQAKLQTQQSEQQKVVVAQVDQQKTAETREAQTTGALAKAQGSFLNGKFGEASMALSVAERLSPDNPLVRDLRSRINGAANLRSRLYFLGGGAGLIGTLGLLAYWLRRRKQQRYLVLELTRGLDTGITYPIEKDLIRIGAVAQDGGQKNDIVLRDVEHAISRFHLEISRKGKQLYVTDLRSSNGTKLDGTAIEAGRPTPIGPGARITLAGAVEMKVGTERRKI